MNFKFSKLSPGDWKEAYKERKTAIKQRLEDFSSVQPERYIYELFYCILTQQSRAVNAESAVKTLYERDFANNNFDATDILLKSKVRFHNTKNMRLKDVKKVFPELLSKVGDNNIPTKELRMFIYKTVNGLGMKESSHFLRNIGFKNLAILDRHILKHLVHHKVIADIPHSLTTRKYLEIENAWLAYSKSIGLPLDELDLLFWSMEAGGILK